MTTNKMKPKNENKQEAREKGENSITLGEIILSSNNLGMDDLLDRLLFLLDDVSIKSYLDELSKRKVMNLSKSYLS